MNAKGTGSDGVPVKPTVVTTKPEPDTEGVSLKLRRGIKSKVISYAQPMGRNLNSQVEFWLRELLNAPDLLKEIELRAAHGHPGLPPETPLNSAGTGTAPQRGKRAVQ